MRIPTFRYMGGKARLRSWLVDLFPRTGYHYIEPFAGLGNVFFLSKYQLKFSKWILSDLNNFLLTLKHFDISLLPDRVTEDQFNRIYKVNPENLISKIIEPAVTFAGKGYKWGFDRSTSNHVGYKKENYSKTIHHAKALLTDTTVICKSYCEILSQPGLGPDDFIYLDPPYYGTNASYPNIDHDDLICRLNSAPYRWAISGYDKGPYKSNLLYVNKFTFERNSEIKSSSRQKYTPVIETLWTNYCFEGGQMINYYHGRGL